MKKVAIYVRSSKDLHNVSCKAQERQLKEVIKANGEQVFQVFTDKAKSSTRDIRPAFEEMISLATSKKQQFDAIYCLDTSRFGRDELHTKVIIHKLRKSHGIEVVFINMPHTGTPMDDMMESILCAFDQFHSQVSKIKGVASMKENARNGFRAGGIAPHGYKLEKIDLGVKRHGKADEKSKLSPNLDTAPIVQEYFLRRSKHESRMSIINDFHRRAIPSPSGNTRWSESTVIGWEDNIRTYLGHTIFNRHNEMIKEGGRSKGFLHGKKWKPEEEWIVTENTHIPLISQETADRIIINRRKGHRASPRHANYIYILSGGILQCSVCGTNYAGDRGYYSCNSKGKTGGKCLNGNIKQERIESAIFALVEKEVFNFRNIKQVVCEIRERFGNRNAEIGILEKDFLKVKEKIRKTVLLYQKEVIKADELESIIKPLREQEELMAERIKLLKEADGCHEVTDKLIRETIVNFREEVKHADPEIKKRVARTLFDSIVIHPKDTPKGDRMLSIKGVCLPLTRDLLVTPRGIEPLLPA